MKAQSPRFVLGLLLTGITAGVVAIAPLRAATLDLDLPAAERQSKLIALVQSDAPPAEKALALKQLAICGTGDAVPSLAGFLGNEQLATWARIALEVIPGPAPDEALRAALTTVRGRPLIGVINSIGVRRDPKAVYPLITKLKDPDAEIASAAAAALGHIGGDSAARALANALADAPANVRSAVAEGCVLCAERWLSEGKAALAVTLYDTVRKADVPPQRRLEATRGAILARGTDGLPLLLEQLRSTDKALYGIGLRTARELPGSQVTKALATELRQLGPERQPKMLLALADRSDDAVLPAVQAAAREGSKELRVTALGVLQHSGNASCIPLLLEAAGADDKTIANAAQTALAGLPGNDVDADLAGRLAQATGRPLQALLEVAAARHLESALPVIVRHTGATDAGVRKAAIEALGALGGPQEIGTVVDLLKAAGPQDRATLEAALLALSGRSGAASAPTLLPLARHSDSSLRIVSLHALAAVGGPEALAAVRNAVEDKEEAVQDEAVRTLSIWPNNWPDDSAVAEPLLALAKSGRKPAHQVLGLRGYLQYLQGAKQLKDEARLAQVKEVLPLLRAPNEKQLAAAVLGAIPTPGALDLLTTFAADPETAEAACSALTALTARGTPGFSRAQRQAALRTVLERSKNDGTRKRAEEALRRLN